MSVLRGAAAAASASLPLPLILLGALALRLYHLDAWAFWADEAASWHFARLPLTEIWGADTMPPLYYSLLHLWLQAGEGEWWLRLSSALVSTGNVALVYLLGRRFAGRPVGLWAAAMLASAAFSLYYAQELRMYALLEGGALVAMLGLAGLLSEPLRAGLPAWRRGGLRRAWGLYALGCLLMLYSHNTGFLLPLTASLLVPVYARRAPAPWPLLRNWLAVNGAVLLVWALYWPWLLQQLRTVGGDFWIQQPDLAGFFAILAELHVAQLPARGDLARAAWPVLAIALAGGTLIALRRRPAWALGLLGLALLPLLIDLVIGIWRPILISRTLIWTAIPGLLAAAVAADWLSRQALVAVRARVTPRGLLAAAALALLLLARGATVVDYYGSQAKADWAAMAELIEQEVPRDAPIVVNPSWQFGAMRYYLHRRFGAAARSIWSFIRYDVEKPAAFRRRLRAARPLTAVWVVFGQGVREAPRLEAILRSVLPCAAVDARFERGGLRLLRYDVTACGGR